MTGFAARTAAMFAVLAAATAAAEPPRVIAFDPPNGSAGLDPGEVTEIVATFDQPMSVAAHSWVGGGESFPEVPAEPYWRDDRTAVLPVALVERRDYSMSVNGGRFTNFRSVSGESAVVTPYLISTRPHPTTSDANRAAIAKLSELVGTRYSYRDLRGIDWDAAFDAARADIEAAPSTLALTLRLRDVLMAADDPHIWLSSGGTRLPTATRVGRRNYDRRALGRLLRDPHADRGTASAWVGPEGAALGYILISTWSEDPALDAALRAALDRLTEASALIIDARMNSGGHEGQAAQFAGRFIGEPVAYAMHRTIDPRATGELGEPVLRTLQPNASLVDKPVFVLTGPAVMSSNEAFVLMMRAAGATIVGEKTFGSSGNPVEHELGQGLSVWLPSWVALDAEGTPFEGVGIEPDVEVLTTDEDLRAGRDPVLARAIKLAVESVEAARER